MNRDRIKGTIDETAGLAKRKVGESLGNTKLEVQGMVQQVKGKVETAWGKAKDSVHDANQEAQIKHKTRMDVELEQATRNDNRGNK